MRSIEIDDDSFLQEVSHFKGNHLDNRTTDNVARSHNGGGGKFQTQMVHNSVSMTSEQRVREAMNLQTAERQKMKD